MHSSSPSEAIIICTRNRPSDLRLTLKSVADQQGRTRRIVLIVDASDPKMQSQNREIVSQLGTERWNHLKYKKNPSLARQRNYGLDRLPPSIKIVHFIDDDVTIESGYFSELSKVLTENSSVGGAGGVIEEPKTSFPSSAKKLARRLFYLDHKENGRVLPSGCTTTAQTPSSNDDVRLHETEWLSGCSSSFRRALLDRHRFDENLTGYSMLEDLDLSYRIGQHSRLVVQPRARLLHRRATHNRPDTERYSYALTIHRRWFIEKHFDGIESRLAYWWSLVGRFLAIAASSTPHRSAALRGLLRGIQRISTRSHPLLSTQGPTSELSDQESGL